MSRGGTGHRAGELAAVVHDGCGDADVATRGFEKGEVAGKAEAEAADEPEGVDSDSDESAGASAVDPAGAARIGGMDELCWRSEEEHALFRLRLTVRDNAFKALHLAVAAHLCAAQPGETRAALGLPADLGGAALRTAVLLRARTLAASAWRGGPLDSRLPASALEIARTFADIVPAAAAAMGDAGGGLTAALEAFAMRDPGGAAREVFRRLDRAHYEALRSAQRAAGGPTSLMALCPPPPLREMSLPNHITAKLSYKMFIQHFGAENVLRHPEDAEQLMSDLSDRGFMAPHFII